MLQESPTKRSWLTSLTLLVALAGIAGLMLLLGTSHTATAAEALAPQATVIAEYDFEDGEQGWVSRGSSVVVEAVTEAAHSGTQSLKVTGRSDTWQGPSVNVLSLLEAGATYEISGCLRLVTGQPDATLRFSMERRPVGGDTTWDWIASSADNGVTDAAWVCVQAEYSFDTAVEALTLYVESPNASVEFYVDDVSIIMTKPAPTEPAQEIAIYNFDDDTTQGWVTRTDIPTTTVTVVSDTFHSPPNSLLVTGREAGWHGASVDVTSLLNPGITYEISGCVKLVTGEPPSRLIISMARTVNGETTYDWVAPSGEGGVTDAEWVCLHGQYTFGSADQLILYVESNNDAATVEFYVDDVTILSPAQPPVQADIPSLHDELSSDFLVGAAIEPGQLDSIRHSELLTRHFNSLTAENVMKPESIQPTEGTFNWAGADKLVQFARDNTIAVHGHTLQWHQQVPDWMFMVGGEPMTPTLENKTLLLDRLETHIRALAGRYRDDVNVWDVVNEVIDPAHPDCMRRSPWYEITGMDYISTAFQIAHEVAPTATLILNDYGTTDTQKRECIYTVVGDLLDAGVPVEGIGMQMHINIQNPPVAAIEDAIKRFASLGVEVHITELDMSIYTSDSDAYAAPGDVPEELLITQGHRYKEIFDVFKRHADDIGSVTFWGIADDHTWLTNRPITRVDLPLLFDHQLQAKYAYWGIVDPSQLPVFIQQLNIHYATPTIDGLVDKLWEMLPWVEIQSSGSITASFQTRWDEEYLYLIVDVEDATDDDGDKIEVFVDQNNGKTEAYEGDDYHYTFPDGSANVMSSWVTTPHGYRFEAAIKGIPTPPATSFPLLLNQHIGFDIRITDGSHPDTPISWNDLTHSQDTDTSKFGTLTLVEPIKLTTAIEGTPTIDGEEDAIWANAPVIDTNVWVIGTSGSTARVKTLWDRTHLYVYAVVSDTLLSKASSNAWEQDSIEIFVDQNNGKTSSYEPDDGQFRVNYENAQSFRGTAATTATLASATRVISDGYVVEAAVTLNDFPPRGGNMIGFDLQVNNDEDGDGTRDSIAIWNDPTGQSYQNTSRLGVLEFIAGPRVNVYLPLVLKQY